jgi:GT2 family glycosyltransferase
MSNTRVTALLVVHDGVTWLPEVVASIASQTHGADQILAIDTGSQDSSAKLLKGARIPTVTLDRTTSFGAALNYGLSQLSPAIAGVEEWLWILHDDCSLEPRALEELLNAVAERPNIVMAGPKLLGWHDRTHLLEVGISIATNGSRWTGLEFNEYDQGQRDGVHEVLAVSTAGALLRRDVFEELGGFDSNLELFRDDVDFGWRVHAAGYSVLVVTGAVGYHAQAAASERRTIDIEGAPLHRPLLLDRRNAAYVLLANSSWWKLPLLSLQLLGGAVIRSLAFLFAKLPGYAGDEILAIASLLLHPGELLGARKSRKKTRLVSAGIVARFIPSRWTQLRSGISHAIENVRSRLFPQADEDLLPIPSELDLNEEEEILQPLRGPSWKTIFLRPLVLAITVLLIISVGWARHRFGTISGGALAPAPAGASDLWRLYLESWHKVGMGSAISAPVWTMFLAAASTLTFGSVSLFLSIFFFLAPFLMLWSAHSYLKKKSESTVLTAGASFLYAISPISITAINSGRLGVVLFLILLPFAIPLAGDWREIEKRSLRSIFAIALFAWLLAAFNPSLLIVGAIFTLRHIYLDFMDADRNYKNPQFHTRLIRRAVLSLIPFVLLAPASLQYIAHPSRLLLEIGLQQAGGGANLALLANPGGEGSLPWWSVSPITLLILIAYFSVSEARRFAVLGGVFLIGATLIAPFRVSGNGSSDQGYVFAGGFLAITTFLSIIAIVIMFDQLRSRLEKTHLNYQHFAVAFVLIVTVAYTATSSLWIFTTGANSPLRHNSSEVLPAYLAVEEGVKTLVMRPLIIDGQTSLAYYISRGSTTRLGEPDVSEDNHPAIASAVDGLIDNTGVTSSKTFAAFGIQYIFLAQSGNKELIQTIDGLGGFNRASATNVGTVWKISQTTGKYLFTDEKGVTSVLEGSLGTVRAPAQGKITLTENFSDSWQAIAEGVQLERSQTEYGLPQFTVKSAGEIIFIHDGAGHRAWISLFLIILTTSVVMALPSGRRRREMLDQELA